MKMTCDGFYERIDDYLDNELPAAQQDAFERHLNDCAGCQRRFSRQQALRADLKAMPVPAPSVDFAERVLRQAVKSNVSHHHRHGFVTGFGSALVAGLALWVVIGFFPAQQAVAPQGAEPLQIVSIALDALNEKQDVSLVFNAERAVLGARISIELPDNVTIAGYPGRKRLEWRTDLAKGSNLLRLPVIASQANSGQLIAHIEHDNRVTTLKIQIDVQKPGVTGSVGLPVQRMA
ncbi:MAG TPA: hypothetical protein ENI94_03565 [Gammaproteobacteria bacterium]|nr:hypothetical protein [Gammaproteobacteria bacterium]